MSTVNIYKSKFFLTMELLQQNLAEKLPVEGLLTFNNNQPSMFKILKFESPQFKGPNTRFDTCFAKFNKANRNNITEVS